ncbi:hypothetical protein [Streptomyces sp. NPDC020667]|uniref:hypothetical protein n=1 Tax=Streptomyces sp. NPDC020667 TaxID=3154895 RepID=UPI0033F1F90C
MDSLSLFLPDSAHLTGWSLAEDGLETFLRPRLPPLVEACAPAGAVAIRPRAGGRRHRQTSDALEAAALTRNFGDRPPLITAPKGVIGHSLGASGGSRPLEWCTDGHSAICC